MYIIFKIIYTIVIYKYMLTFTNCKDSKNGSPTYLFPDTTVFAYTP